MISTTQFLESIYLPGYMTVLNADYSGNVGLFKFKPAEPPVTILSDRYLTPRGTHISLSQGGICFVEQMIHEDKLDDLTIEELRGTTREGRLKLVEFNQRFRREVGLSDSLQGKMILTKHRSGKIPVVRFDFDLGNRSVIGDFTAVIAPHPVPQTNTDILR
ncbi:MAG: hypothetical protein Q8Q42_03600 [Nanoarchaeota archaeon]|nr:hypothetical protein [Nanoarchaeota archaeon]